MTSRSNEPQKAPLLPLSIEELREQKARSELSDADRLREVFVSEPASLPAPPDRNHAAPQAQPAIRPADTHLRVYSHSTLIYWWPAWAVGYAMAVFTRWRGGQFQIGADAEWFHPSSSIGVLFFLTLILVVVITNVPVRGLASGLVLLGAALVTVTFAMLGWWDPIFAWFGDLKIHLNYGAYFWFSTLLLTIWLLSVFVVDRMSCWQFTPGQVTHEMAFGAGSKSFDTNGMVLEKHREDLFRHWLLGLGSGDLQIRTTGATSEQIDVHNVMFLGRKIARMQRMIAEEPGPNSAR